MVLIFSQSIEYTTIQVIDWISHYKAPFKRVNGTEFYKNFNLSITGDGVGYDLHGIDLQKVNVVWLWRWMGFEDRHDNFFRQDSKSIDPVKLQLNQFLRGEFKALVSFFLNFVPKEKMFSRVDMEELNKLAVLIKAQEFGLEIPSTYITSRKDAYASIRHHGLITKAISNAPFVEHENVTYLGYTSVVDELPPDSSDVFSPSLFQEQIQKKYEIRSFFLDGSFYSMAIFSQSDDQTAVDFRVYNHKNPNRTVPFQLPKSVEEKLLKVMNFFGLKSGSIDIIKTTDNRYVFLEINCSGQFGMVSHPCNYYLEKKMATKLINYTAYEV